MKLQHIVYSLLCLDSSSLSPSVRPKGLKSSKYDFDYSEDC